MVDIRAVVARGERHSDDESNDNDAIQIVLFFHSGSESHEKMKRDTSVHTVSSAFLFEEVHV